MLHESSLLDDTLTVLERDGAAAAYQYLLAHKSQLQACSSQLYNFLYCLAAVSNAPDEALSWMREAIVEKGYWYRPEVFDDEDLDTLREEADFCAYRTMSHARYYKALEQAQTRCTWQGITQGKLALVLHGNQQNMHTDSAYWQFLAPMGYQVEYVQSKTIDSCDLYRWDDDSETQLDRVVEQIPWRDYDSRMLCGFSAGCNEILKTLLKPAVTCEKILLYSPWIPVIESRMDDLMAALSGTSIEIICGSEDRDCLPHALALAAAADRHHLDCSFRQIAGLGHRLPESGS